jgi:hypothetical protein
MDLKGPGPSAAENEIAADAEQFSDEGPAPLRSAEVLSFEPLPQSYRSRRRAVPQRLLLACAIAGGVAVGVVGTYAVKDDLLLGQRTPAPAANVAGSERVRPETSPSSANALIGSARPEVSGTPAAAPPTETAPAAFVATPPATAGAGSTAASSGGAAGNQPPGQGAPSETAASPEVATAGPAPSGAAAVGSSEPSAMIGIAMARGDDALARGDVISARQFYELAASMGLAHAATAVGSTYDPNFVTAKGVRGSFTDTEAAKQWYQKGIAGGDAEARLRLDKLLKVAKDSR